MDAHLEQLDLVLGQQVAGLTALRNWLPRKIELIKSNRQDELLAFTQREEEQVSRLQAAESQRTVLMGLIALELGLDASLPLSQLIPHLPVSHQERLAKRRDQLNNVVAALREGQIQADGLLRFSLEYVHFTMDVFAQLASAVPAHSYGSSGDMSAPSSASWLVDRQA